METACGWFYQPLVQWKEKKNPKNKGGTVPLITLHSLPFLHHHPEDRLHRRWDLSRTQSPMSACRFYVGSVCIPTLCHFARSIPRGNNRDILSSELLCLLCPWQYTRGGLGCPCTSYGLRTHVRTPSNPLGKKETQVRKV